MTTSRTPLNPVVIGADIGNATTSVVVGSVGRPNAFFPSFVANVGIDDYVGASKIATARHHIKAGGVNALVGDHALQMGGTAILSELDQAEAWKRYTNARSTYCLLAGVSAAFPETDLLGVTLATGAPLSIFNAYGDKIAKHYTRKWQYAYNGHERTVVIPEVRIFGEGRELPRLLPYERRMGKLAVHDIGGRTWNVLLFYNGALIGAETFDMGIDRLLRRIAAVPSDPGGRWAIQREMRADDRAHMPIRSALRRLMAAYLPVIQEKVRIDRAESHAVAGGGAFDLAAVLHATFGAASVGVLNGDAPESANAVAYALAASEVA